MSAAVLSSTLSKQWQWLGDPRDFRAELTVKKTGIYQEGKRCCQQLLEMCCVRLNRPQWTLGAVSDIHSVPMKTLRDEGGAVIEVGDGQPASIAAEMFEAGCDRITLLAYHISFLNYIRTICLLRCPSKSLPSCAFPWPGQSDLYHRCLSIALNVTGDAVGNLIVLTLQWKDLLCTQNPRPPSPCPRLSPLWSF